MSVIKTVCVREFGILPDTGLDCSESVRAMLAEHSKNCTFLFEPGCYDFFYQNALRQPYALSNTIWLDERKIAILLKNMKNIVFDGQGAMLLFHGQMIAVAADHCEALTIRNLRFDWSVPLSAEGTVLHNTGDTADLVIDQRFFPCTERNGVLWFQMEDGETELAICAHSEFEAGSMKMAIGGGDAFRPTTVKQLESGVFRFCGDFSHCAKPGNIIVLRHTPRTHCCLFAEKCKDTIFCNLTIHNSGGLGILAQFCEALHFEGVRFLPNRIRGRRVLSGHDDGLQLSNNRGNITVERCYFYGLMDDPINLHGTYIKVSGTAGDRTLRGRFMHEQSTGFRCWAEPGDQLALTDPDTLVEIGAATVESYGLTGRDECLIALTEPLTTKLCPCCIVENVSNTAALTCRSNVFGSCRGRGLLVTTRQRVLIEHNLFESSGAAILISGDACSWYESGPCCDVLVRRNIFTDRCGTSVYGRPAGTISICPEIKQKGEMKPFHRNIRIEDNDFYAYQMPILDTLGADVTFFGNRILRSTITYDIGETVG